MSDKHRAQRARTGPRGAKFHLGLLFENSPDAIVLADDCGAFLDANELACSLFGRPRDQVLCMHVGDLITPTTPVADDQYDHYLQSGKEVGVFSFVRAEGDVRTLSYSACRLAPNAHLSILKDITEEVEAKNSLAVEAKRLEVLNRRLTRALTETHHRVKNSLQVISALVDLQVDSDEATVPVSALLRIGRHARSLAALHDLLTGEFKSRMQADTLSTGAMMDKLVSLLRISCGDREISHRIQDFKLTVRESASLALLVSELVSNALKHGDGVIEIELSRFPSHAELTVMDHGPGFPHNFDWRTGANTGISLIESTARFDLSGAIVFERAEGAGARVVVTFPLCTHPGA